VILQPAELLVALDEQASGMRMGLLRIPVYPMVQIVHLKDNLLIGEYILQGKIARGPILQHGGAQSVDLVPQIVHLLLELNVRLQHGISF
jgi:hypothetical protein